MNLGPRIRELRQARGLTQQHLAAAIGTGPQYLYQVESGFRQPSLSAIERLAEVLAVPIAELFGSQPLTTNP